VSSQTLRERQILHGMLRIQAAHCTLGIDGPARLILGCFLQECGRWTVSTISNYTHLPRTTVLRRLEGFASEGLVARYSDGWELTEPGRDLVCKVSSETAQVLMGERIGFSPELIQMFKAAPVLSYDLDEKSALRISFPPMPKK